jgi:Mg2+ and Co2+ transporter CorA
MASLQDWTLNLKANTTKLDASIRTVTDKAYTVTLKADGTSVTKLKQEVESADGKLKGFVTTTTKYNKQGAYMSETVTLTSKAVKTLGQDFADTLVKVTKFAAVTAVIGAVTAAFSKAIEVVKDYNDAITELSKVTDYSLDELSNYAQELGDLGTSVARDITTMTEAATGWVKAGYSEEDAAKLAQYTALLQNTADETYTASEATEVLVSQLKAYSLEADDAVAVTDILNAVSANEAVSFGDLAKGLTQASSTMSTFGNDINETTALLTAGTTVNFLEKLL